MKNFTLLSLLIIATIMMCANVDINQFSKNFNLTGGPGVIDLNNLDDYVNQPVPVYITEDNTPPTNLITDIGATLGRVLFYDKRLSSNSTISCASCHIQQFAFTDTAQVSIGVNGSTGRHAMRLINARFAAEQRFFWDERAPNLEFQTTQPIQDHGEMGFSGTLGDPDFDSLIRKLEVLPYYQMLFTATYGDATVTELRMQQAMAQFIRSIQSFDSKYDAGRAISANNNVPFQNFTTNENAGKALFMFLPQIDSTTGVRVGGGLGCNRCHQAPEFDIRVNSGNNGFIGSLGGGQDLTNTRSPTLRDILDANGNLHSPLMHTGDASLQLMISHYDSLPASADNPDLDVRLRPVGNLQNLNMTPVERMQLIEFLETLTGTNVYVDPKWSDPFDANNDLVITPLVNTENIFANTIKIYPNPVTNTLNLDIPPIYKNSMLQIFSANGAIFYNDMTQSRLDVSEYPSGVYFIKIEDLTFKFVKL